MPENAANGKTTLQVQHRSITANIWFAKYIIMDMQAKAVYHFMWASHQMSKAT